MKIIKSNFVFDSKNFRFRYENISNKIAERFFKNKPLINPKVLTFKKIYKIILK